MKTFTVILFLLLFPFSFPAFAETVYDRVMETKTIRCGYALYTPSLMKDPNTGKLSGFTYDIFEKIGELNNIKIEWSEEVDYGNIIQGFVTNRYDIFCGLLWPIPERAQQAIFTTPIYFSTVGIYVRSNDNRFDNNPRKLNSPDYKLSVLDGDITDSIAKADFPNAQKVSIPQTGDLSLLMVNVQSRKADAVFIEKNFADQFIDKNPGSLKNIVPNNPVRVYPNVYMLPKNEFQLKSVIDTTLQELIYRGYVEETVKKYSPKNSVIYNVAKPYEVSK